MARDRAFIPEDVMRFNGLETIGEVMFELVVKNDNLVLKIDGSVEVELKGKNPIYSISQDRIVKCEVVFVDERRVYNFFVVVDTQEFKGSVPSNEELGELFSLIDDIPEPAYLT